ncbi:hypothetical protein AU15_03875 [Marinobacter salarius]|uniref:Uncharacterized protein n=1 Tax=Marinobacter salarius TaxID=1420917 RepID=W5YVX0_9GAMM|nr:hypothetical protein AU15_03875 [Marinobacter salarius]
MGKVGDARQWFERAASEDSPEEVQTLARHQLADVTAESPLGQRHGSGYLAVAGGYDDNIAGTPDDVSSDKEGGFADALAAGTVQLGMKELSLHGVAFTRQYLGTLPLITLISALVRRCRKSWETESLHQPEPVGILVWR